ncbi:MAG TPA: NAD(P)(+) transhydrogenase (Re/Si-specific) subunit beta [Anaeromyxobacter sp.]
MTPRTALIQGAYLAASVLFVLGLRSLTVPDRARRGMRLAAVGMLVAICGTLLHHDIVRFDGILVGLAVGAAAGWPLGVYVPMTAMPQRIAISHMFGAIAATLVGVAEFWRLGLGARVGRFEMAALGFEVLFGALTVTGSLLAFGKLQALLPSRPLTFRGQNVVSVALFGAAVALFGALLWRPASPAAFFAMVALALAFGMSLVLPIGGADMPVVISLLNSYAGLASAATGFAIGNEVLILAGALDGASGFILSVIMSRAMNRSFGNVLFGAFGAAPVGEAPTAQRRVVHAITPEDAAIQLAWARLVIVVPGYGMAVAQAQHQVRELATVVEKNGGTVLYAIHPVAGRMPGHMNVLLAEADVPYDRLKEMDEINPEFEHADVALVVGANDVVNPAAREDRTSPIYGMPILDVDRAKQVIVLKRSMNPGFAGIENALFYRDNTAMLFGDAKQSLAKLVQEIKAA